MVESMLVVELVLDNQEECILAVDTELVIQTEECILVVFTVVEWAIQDTQVVASVEELVFQAVVSAVESELVFLILVLESVVVSVLVIQEECILVVVLVSVVALEWVIHIRAESAWVTMAE